MSPGLALRVFPKQSIVGVLFDSKPSARVSIFHGFANARALDVGLPESLFIWEPVGVADPNDVDAGLL